MSAARESGRANCHRVARQGHRYWTGWSNRAATIALAIQAATSAGDQPRWSTSKSYVSGLAITQNQVGGTLAAQAGAHSVQHAHHGPHGLPPQFDRPLPRRGDLRITGRGGAHHQKQRNHPSTDRGHLVGKDAYLPPRIGLGTQRRHPLAIQKHHIAVISSHRPVDHLNEQICLATDRGVHRLHGDPCRACHLSDGGRPIARFQETLPGGGHHPPPGLKPLLLSQAPAFGRVIGAGTYTTGHNPCHNNILARMPLYQTGPEDRARPPGRCRYAIAVPRHRHPGLNPVRGQRCAPKTSTPQRAAPLRSIRASAVTKEAWRASARATYCASQADRLA